MSRTKSCCLATLAVVAMCWCLLNANRVDSTVVIFNTGTFAEDASAEAKVFQTLATSLRKCSTADRLQVGYRVILGSPIPSKDCWIELDRRHHELIKHDPTMHNEFAVKENVTDDIVLQWAREKRELWIFSK